MAAMQQTTPLLVLTPTWHLTTGRACTHLLFCTHADKEEWLEVVLSNGVGETPWGRIVRERGGLPGRVSGSACVFACAVCG